MNFTIVRDVLNHRCVFINIEKIVSIQIKPVVNVDNVDKEAKAAIVMDNDNIIYIDETAEELFKRIAIGTGCIRLEVNNIPRMKEEE